MLNIELDKETGIATLSPDGPLSKDDFESAARIIDPYILESAELNGLIIRTKSFPGWQSFGALIGHFQFVKEHHKKIAYVAIVTDSMFGNFAEKVADHFISAEIKHFAFDDLQSAHNWILNIDQVK